MKSIARITGKIIERPPGFFRRMLPGVVFRLPEKEPVVYLTFDDGPIPEVTPWVLDTLDRYGVKATFFMVGDNVRKYPELYKEVLKRGHSVANHTMHHLNGIKFGSEAYLDDVSTAAGYIESGMFRPPHGWMRPAQLKGLKEHYRVILCDVVTRDYSRHLTAADIVRTVKRLTRNGSIIMFHDSLKSWQRIETGLPEALEWLISEGYKFKTL